VTALGDVLQHLASPDKRDGPLHAVVDEWRDLDALAAELNAVAREQSVRARAGMPFVVGPLSLVIALLTCRQERRKEPPESSRLEVWIDHVGRVLAERTWDGPDGRVQDRGSAVTREAGCLFSAAKLQETVASLDLTAEGEGELAGRPVVTAVGASPSGGRLGPCPDWLPAGADEWRLAFDRVHGYLLRVEARRNGAPFETSETISIEYGSLISEES
jgi:hypothetical protein